MKKLNLLVVCCLTIECSAAQNFILSKPQVLKTSHFKQSEDEGRVEATTPSRYYEVPPPVSTPSSFYQVPSMVSQPSPPPPSPTPTQVSQITVTEDTLTNTQQLFTNTVLSKPGAIVSGETEKFLISSGAASSSLSIVATPTDTKLASTSLSAGTALLISFLLSLIPTLAVSIPFIAFRRRIVTQGRSSHIFLDDLLAQLLEN